jgi:hypothetical protein
MKIEDLLKIKLKNDLLKELSNRYKFNQFSKKEYLILCESKIDLKLKDISFLNKKKKCGYSSEERCCARIWDNHYGSRCKYKRNKTDYCNHHNNMIKRTGKLYLNRYDEDKPLFNEKGNRFPWFVDPNMEMLNNIIQKQDKMLKSLIKKERQIAPKI